MMTAFLGKRNCGIGGETGQHLLLLPRAESAGAIAFPAWVASG